MPFCTACGAEIGAEDAFCTACGEPVERSDRAAGANRDIAADQATAGTEPTSRAVEDIPAASPETEEERTSPTIRETRGRQLAAAGAGLAGIGAFLPWIEVEFLSQSETVIGIDGDGKITLAFAVIAGIALLLGKGSPWTRRSRVTALVLGALTVLIGVYYLNDPMAGTDVSRALADEIARRGSGLYLTTIGGGSLALGSLYATVGSGE